LLQKTTQSVYTTASQFLAGNWGHIPNLIQHKPPFFALGRHKHSSLTLFGVLCRKRANKFRPNVQNQVLMWTGVQHNNC